MVRQIGRDLRYAVRTLGRAPGFATVAVLTLALGANTAIFTVIDGVLLRPLPYPDADRLVRIVEREPLAAQGDARAIVEHVAPMTQFVSHSIARQRFFAVLLGLFAGVAVLLAAVGIYGVMTYAVAQRTREIGSRMALGAARAEVMGLVLRQSLAIAIVGIGLGLGGAAAVARSLATLLYDLAPLDPATFIGVALLFGAIATLAAYVPARRATTVDPLIALR